MISLSYQSGVQFRISERMVEKLEGRADGGTTIIMESGNQYSCKETPQEVEDLIHSASGGGARGAKDHSKCPCQVVLGGPLGGFAGGGSVLGQLNRDED